MASVPDPHRAHWRLWRDRVWAARQSLANVEHRLENPPRPASEQPEDSTNVEAARTPLTQLEAVLQESLVTLAAIADEMASYRDAPRRVDGFLSVSTHGAGGV